jgi:hypothetical protein
VRGRLTDVVDEIATRTAPDVPYREDSTTA